MQKGEALQAMQTDLKETISILKKAEYERALRRASNAIDLGAIEFQVRTDSRLSQEDRVRLLNRVDKARKSSPPHAQTEHSR